MELRTQFEKESGYRFTSCNLCVNVKCKNTHICDYWEKYARWLEGQRANNWISVETPPKQGGVYLATDREEIMVSGYWPGFGVIWGDLDTNRAYAPTHWQPLPEAPE